MYDTHRIHIRLGGANLNLPVYVMVGGSRNPKVVALAEPRTIPRSAQFQGKDEPYSLAPGWILGWRQSQNGRVWYHIRSLYEAIRSFHHAMDSEGSAQQDALITIQAAMELVRDLLAYWPLESGQHESLSDKLTELCGKLEDARDPFLQDAADHLFAASGFEDDSGIPRLYQSTVRIYTARRLVTIRLSDILRIAPRLSHIQVRLAEELSVERYNLLEYCLGLLLSARRKNDLESIWRDLIAVRDSTLKTIRVAPFYKSAWKIRVDIRRALEILQPPSRKSRIRSASDRINEVRPLLDNMVREIARRRAQDMLEMDIIRPVSCTVLSANDRIQLAARVDQFRAKINRLYVDSDTRTGLSALLQEAADNLRGDRVDAAKEMLKNAAGLL